MNLSKTLVALLICLALCSGNALALSSANIPLDSPIYVYIEKLSGFGLVRSDFKGLKPFTKSEAARLLIEAEGRLASGEYPPLAREAAARLRELIPREASLYQDPDKAPAFDYLPVASARVRYVYLDGQARSYDRAVNDHGNDGFFGFGHGLRPPNPYPSPVQQHGTEGTPLFENNEGVVYHQGSNVEARVSAEAYGGQVATAFLEPMFLWSEWADEADVRLKKGYLKLGGKGLELEVGRDENWLGLGYRGSLTLSDNSKNFDEIKLSSPEPVVSRYLWDLKYALIFSRLEKTVTSTGVERQPYFFGGKLTFKPTTNSELGFNLGRQVGGPGVDNDALGIMRGLIGGMRDDNSNSVAGFELRFRFPFLRYTEIFAEYSGEDAAAFWPIVESYLAGFYIPNLTAGGRDDLRFEYFFGNNILYTNATFPEGYLHYGMPIGHAEGGATQDLFLRYSHWFSIRDNLALEFFRTTRGDYGRLPVNARNEYQANGDWQSPETKHAVRAVWTFPVRGDWNALLSYGQEWIHNLDLRSGMNRSNVLVRAELSYRY